MSKSLERWNDGLSGREKVGGGLVLSGLGAGGIMVTAAILPFIGPLLLIAIMIVAGLVIAL